MYLLLFSLSFKTVLRINTYSPSVFLSSYGFMVNGSFFVCFEDSKYNQSFSLVSDKSNELNKFYGNGLIDLCRNSSMFEGILLNITSNNRTCFNGSISEKGVYIPVIFTCGPPIIDTKAEMIFRNPNTNLDYRWEGGNWSRVLLIFVLLLILFHSIYSSFKNYKSFCPFHVWILVSILICLANQVVSYIEIIKLSAVDEVKDITFMKQLLHLADSFFIMMAAISVSLGNGIIAQKVSFFSYIPGFIYVVTHLMMESFSSQGVIDQFSTIASIVSLIFVFLYFREIYINTVLSKSDLYAHLVVISQHNIDPFTTPIFKNYRFIKDFFNCFIISMVLVVLRLTIIIFSNPYFWIQEFLIEFVFTLSLVFIYQHYFFNIQSKKSIFLPEKTSIMYNDVIEYNIYSTNLPKYEDQLLPPQPMIIKGLQGQK